MDYNKRSTYEQEMEEVREARKPVELTREQVLQAVKHME